jgi:hypothetical protein
MNSPNRFVLPVPQWLRGKFLDKTRLYAYPVEPEAACERGFVILDSGAFALSMRGESMTNAYMENLNLHYAKYSSPAFGDVVCTAPDVFLDPKQTMANFAYWRNMDYVHVSPVLQCSKKRKITLYELQKQIDFYARYCRELRFIALSNPSLRAVQCDAVAVRELLNMIRCAWDGIWIHNFGAGWDGDDVKRWLAMGFDSIDSIAYYTDAEKRLIWSAGGNTMKCSGDRVQAAIFNEQVANPKMQ